MPPKLPRISVFLPTYNQSRFVRAAIDSVLLQDYNNIEIVIGDDGSTDDTKLILQEYKDKHPDLINLILSPTNEGITANCNKILRACTGKYIALFAGDDIWLPGKLQRQVCLMESNMDAVICATKVEWFDDVTGDAILVHPPDTKTDTSGMSIVRLAAYIAGAGPSLMVRSNAIPSHGFESKVPLVSDWLFYIEILRSGDVIFDENLFAKYRRHSGNTSANVEIIFKEHIETLKIVRHRYPDLRGDIDDYTQHYLKDNVLKILFGRNTIQLKIYSFCIAIKHLRLSNSIRILYRHLAKHLKCA